MADSWPAAHAAAADVIVGDPTGADVSDRFIGVGVWLVVHPLASSAALSAAVATFTPG